jgi:hypothetical protein
VTDRGRHLGAPLPQGGGAPRRSLTSRTPWRPARLSASLRRCASAPTSPPDRLGESPHRFGGAGNSSRDAASSPRAPIPTGGRGTSKGNQAHGRLGPVRRQQWRRIVPDSFDGAKPRSWLPAATGCVEIREDSSPSGRCTRESGTAEPQGGHGRSDAMRLSTRIFEGCEKRRGNRVGRCSEAASNGRGRGLHARNAANSHGRQRDATSPRAASGASCRSGAKPRVAPLVAQGRATGRRSGNRPGTGRWRSRRRREHLANPTRGRSDAVRRTGPA